jgi:uncharacterized protein YxjI
MSPFDVVVQGADGQPVLKVKRGVSLFLSKVQVFDEQDRYVGGFDQKLFSIGGRFDVLDAAGAQLCTLQGKWKDWEFRFFSPTHDFARVTKKWAGLAKELLPGPDDFVLGIKETVAPEDPARLLIWPPCW